MAVKVKIKPLTSEIIEETAEHSGEPIILVREVFHSYWKDIRTLLFSCTGHSVYVLQWGTFFMNMRRVDTILRGKFTKLKKNMIFLKGEKYGTNKALKVRLINECLKSVSQIVLIIESFKLYEKDITSRKVNYGKKNRNVIEEYSKRMEELFDLPISELQVTVYNSVQKEYVQKLRKSGLLPNPVVYQNKEV